MAALFNFSDCQQSTTQSENTQQSVCELHTDGILMTWMRETAVLGGNFQVVQVKIADLTLFIVPPYSFLPCCAKTLAVG